MGVFLWSFCLFCCSVLLFFFVLFKIFFSPARFDLCNPMGTQHCWRQAGLHPCSHRHGGPKSGQQGDQHCEPIVKHLSLEGTNGGINNNSLLQSFFSFFFLG